MVDLTIFTNNKEGDIASCQETKRKLRQAGAFANSLIVQHRITEVLPLWQILNRAEPACNTIALRDWIFTHESFESVDEHFQIGRELLMNIDNFMSLGLFD